MRSASLRLEMRWHQARTVARCFSGDRRRTKLLKLGSAHQSPPATQSSAGSRHEWSELSEGMSKTSHGRQTERQVGDIRMPAGLLLVRWACWAFVQRSRTSSRLGLAVVAGSISNEMLIVDARHGSRGVTARFRDHRHYVQGVSWDPRGEMLLSAAGDRSVRTYSLKHFSGSKKAERKTCAQTAKDFLARNTLRTRILPGADGAEAEKVRAWNFTSFTT